MFAEFYSFIYIYNCYIYIIVIFIYILIVVILEMMTLFESPDNFTPMVNDSDIRSHLGVP